MAEIDAVFAAMDADLFAEYGEDATVQRGVAVPVSVRVVLQRGVETLGEFGQLVGRVDLIHFQVAEWQPKQGDVVALTSGSRKVERPLDDDGSVIKAVLYA